MSALSTEPTPETLSYFYLVEKHPGKLERLTENFRTLEEAQELKECLIDTGLDGVENVFISHNTLYLNGTEDIEGLETDLFGAPKRDRQ